MVRIPALVLLLLLGMVILSGMTSQEFNQYWIGGGLNAAGRCSTIVHPRLIIDSTTVVAAQTWCSTAGTLNYVTKGRMETFWNTKHSTSVSAAEYPVIIANVYLDAAKKANTTYVGECTTYVGRMGDANFECNWATNQTMEGVHREYGLCSATAFQYDLTYKEINASRRRSLQKKLSKAKTANMYEDSGGALWQWTNYKLIPMLAVYGDSADATFNEVLRDSICAEISLWENRVCNCLQSLDNIGYQEQYYAQRHGARLFAAAAVKSCFPGYHSAFDDTDAITEAGDFYRLMCRTDLPVVSGASQVRMHRSADKFNTKGWNPVVTLALQDKEYDDKDSWILARYFGINDYGLGPNNTSGIAGTFFPAAFCDPNKYTTNIALSDIQKKYMWSPVWGVFGMRSAWNSHGSSNTDIQVMYYPFHLEGAGHHNAGHMQMMRGADWIFNNAGAYYPLATDLEDEYQLWLGDCLSKNTIAIWQTGETTFDGATTFAVVDSAVLSTKSTCATPFEAYKSFGFQSRGDATLGLAALNGDCNYSGSSRPQMYYRGHNIQDCIENGTVYYIATDLSYAYSTGKQTYARRAFYSDAGSVVITLDQVKVKSNVTYVATNVHTINAPLNQTGSITVLRGGGFTSADSIGVDSDGGYAGGQGGIYKVTGNTMYETNSAMIKTTNGNSAGWLVPLEIRNATAGTTGFLYNIGGVGKSGHAWMQRKYPCVTGLWATNTYDTGFACWVWPSDGPMSTDAWNAAPSSHAAGTCNTFSCDDGVTTRKRIAGNNVVVNSSSYETNRNNSPDSNLGHGSDVGDWTTYLVNQNPSNNDICETFACYIATASGASAPTVRYTHTGEIVAVAVSLSGTYTMHVLPTPTSATDLTTMTWDNPLTSEDATVRVVGLIPNHIFTVKHGSTPFTTATSDSYGYLTWFHSTNAVTSFTLSDAGPINNRHRNRGIFYPKMPKGTLK